MLLTFPYKNGDTVSLKLVSGEEVVARLVEEDADFITISKPLSLGMGQNGPALTGFMLTAQPSHDIKLRAQHVLTTTKTEDVIASQYLQSTTSIALN
jgi:hypothetical protein